MTFNIEILHFSDPRPEPSTGAVICDYLTEKDRQPMDKVALQVSLFLICALPPSIMWSIYSKETSNTHKLEIAQLCTLPLAITFLIYAISLIRDRVLKNGPINGKVKPDFSTLPCAKKFTNISTI